VAASPEVAALLGGAAHGGQDGGGAVGLGVADRVGQLAAGGPGRVAAGRVERERVGWDGSPCSYAGEFVEFGYRDERERRR
jgi:hypothetical protein